jgi:hypothetical protein
MSYRRCLECRTWFESDGDGRCIACGASVPEGAGRPASSAPSAHQGTLRDLGTARIVFAVIGGLAVFNFCMGLGVAGLITHFPAALLVLAAVAAVVARHRKGFNTAGAGRGIFTFLEIIGVVVVVLVFVGLGLIILLFIACATGGLKLG